VSEPALLVVAGAISDEIEGNIDRAMGVATFCSFGSDSKILRKWSDKTPKSISTYLQSLGADAGTAPQQITRNCQLADHLKRSFHQDQHLVRI
jgi:hypothetical protein